MATSRMSEGRHAAMWGRGRGGGKEVEATSADQDGRDAKFEHQRVQGGGEC